MDYRITTCGAVTLGFRNITIPNHHELSRITDVNIDDFIDMSACDVAAEPMTYYIILVMGICFCIIYSFVALNSNRFGMKWLLSKKFFDL